MRAMYHMRHQVSDVHQFQHHAVQLSKSSQVIEKVAKGAYYAGLSYEQDARTWKQKDTLSQSFTLLRGRC